MSRIGQAFRDHPASVGETYLEHLRSALGFSFAMSRAAVCCAIHAFVPILFQRTGSSAIEELHRRMLRQRDARQLPQQAARQTQHEPTASRSRAAA